MCGFCGRYTCHPRCPRADECEPEPMGKCDDCGEDVFENEDYTDAGGVYRHLECAKESAEELEEHCDE